MLNIAIFGAPGVGKGTQSALIEKKYNLVHISTGDILREETSKGTELGLKAKSYMEQGQLIPDDLIIGMLEKKVDENINAEGILYDGFPRTVKQAEALDVMFEKKGLKLDTFLCLTADHDTLVARLLNRAKDSGRADDADVNVIENRIKEVYKANVDLKNKVDEDHKNAVECRNLLIQAVKEIQEDELKYLEGIRELKASSKEA